jgi:type IV secretory pathway TraG/TraD family ATPase VirD4
MRPAMPTAGGQAVPSQGVVLGVTHAHGETMPVMIDERHRTLHHFILGATGTGKSTLIQHMLLQDMRRGDGVILVDFHGDLCAELLGRIPRNRVHDVVYFNPADLAYPIGLNVMASERSPEERDEEREGIVNVLLNYFERTCHPDHVGPVFFQTVRNGLLLAMAGDSAERPATLLDFVEVFLKPEAVKRKLPALTNPLARHYWTDMYNHENFRRSGGDGATMLNYVLSKFSPFVDLALTRNILCRRDGLLLREVMDSRKILLCNVSKGRLGPSAAMFLGFLIMFRIEQAALARAAMPEADRARTCVYIDEVENLDTRNFAGLASEMRKYNVSLTLACQHLSQLDRRMRDALLGNCGTITAFRIGPSDADALADFFTPLPRRSLLHLPNHHAVVRTMGEDHPQVMGLTTLPMVKPSDPALAAHALAAHVIGYSQNVYGRPRAAVELELCAETVAVQDQPEEDA